MKENKNFLERLSINMDAFYQTVERITQGDIKKMASFNKLYDHVKLECSRMIYIKEIKGELAQRQEELNKNQEELKEKQEILGKNADKALGNINNLYINLISIISVFVAIFALITVNANISFDLTTQNMADVFWGIVKINIFVVVCISILLLLVRILIINKLEKSNRDNEKK